MKHKFGFKQTFFVLMLATAGLFGVSATIVNKQVEEKPTIEKTEAATLADAYYIKFKNKWGNNWDCTIDNYWLQYYDGSSWKYASSMDVEEYGGNKYKKWVPPSNAQYFKFYCWNTDYAQNRTVQLSPQSNGNNVFEVTSTNASAEQTGTWSYHCDTTTGNRDYYLDATNWGLDYSGSAPTIQLYYWDDVPGTTGTVTATQLKSGYPFYRASLTGNYKFLWRKGTSFGDKQTGDFNVYEYPVATKNLCNASATNGETGTWYKTSGSIQSFTFYTYYDNASHLYSDVGDSGSFYLFNGENFGLSGVALPSTTKTGYNTPSVWNEGSFNGTERSSDYSYTNVTSNYNLYATYIPKGGTVIASDKARVWIGYDMSNPFYKDNAWIKLKIVNYSTNAEVEFIGTYSGSYNNNQETLPGGAVSGSDKRRYDYFDISASRYTDAGTYAIIVQRYKSDGTGNPWNETAKFKLKNTDAGKVYFIWSDFSTISVGSIVDSGGNNANIDTLMAVWALEGLKTCSSTKCNGYYAFNNIRDSFFVDPTGGTTRTVGDDLDDILIYDYQKFDTSYSGSRNYMTTAQSKYDWLNYKKNGGPMPSPGAIDGFSPFEIALGDSETNFATIIIIVASSVSLLSITALSVLVIKKRKEKQ